jgi:single-strand DNA-binding protein
MSINKVMLIGRLGQDPELKYTPSGIAVANFSVATSDSWTDKSGQKQEKTEWHRIVVWGKLAELCNQYLSKGRQAFLEGSLQTRSWEKDGVKRYSTEIVAKNVQFLGSASDSNRGQKQDQGSSRDSNYEPPKDGYDVSTDADFAGDDIPF